MTDLEYKEAMDKLSKEHQRQIQALQRAVALKNNPYKTGDVVTDRSGSLRIEKIKIHVGLNVLPECVYFGVELAKNGSPAKRQTQRGVYQCNIIKS